MSRKLQHITWTSRAEVAAKNGEKVEALCGQRVYQMPNMKDEIPTCTPCTRALQAEHQKAVTKPPFVVTYTTSGNATWANGGAA